MKYLKLFEGFDESEIRNICEKYGIKNYTINPDESIDVDGHVDFFNEKLTKLPLKFNKVNGWFIIANNKLTSLEGSPKEVNGDFYCTNNKLTTFEFAPKIIRGDFYCTSNNIKSFEYFPSYVKGGFYCIGNPIYEVCKLFQDLNKIELLNDFD